ncbi:response regulator [Goodfellowiella coeruleoviolacea]|uniref:Response regulator receiver domain-containing protein n=1 Tax=Goodfellowiella coeruleoviolacea TaxID=334858 RepID=A0AAE3G986_9PSEU|nr:response regulator transcription factor [Goodfellowiella coeruleoviolacea]MCP2164026.1 Response regulator receiver domain-containing protein [Goodfellowiella coeruleoviolacea]
MTTPPRSRVLIADDDAMIRSALRAVLDAEPDLEVIAVARDAGEAVVLAEQHTPAVAVLDVRMPGGGGTRAAREIRLRSPNTRLLAFSAHSEMGALDQMRRVGVTECLVKGVSNAEIVATVRRLAQAAPGQ